MIQRLVIFLIGLILIGGNFWFPECGDRTINNRPWKRLGFRALNNVFLGKRKTADQGQDFLTFVVLWCR